MTDDQPAPPDAPRPGHGPSRRRVLRIGLALLAAGTITGIARTTGYDAPRQPLGNLSNAQAAVLAAAARAVLDPSLQPDIDRVVAGVDAYLTTMPPAFMRNITALFVAVEQAPLLAGHASRFSRLPADEGRRVLERLDGIGGLAPQVSRGIRDLCMLGYWQQPAAWGRIGYEGPLVKPVEGPRHPAYAALEAPRGSRPGSMRRRAP
jgi:D-cysteine desulfhydrase